MKNVRGIGFVALGFAALSGCGLNMQKNYAYVRPQLLTQNYDAADRYIDSVKESFYSKDNRLLYYMDKGTVLNLAKRYKESNEVLEKAKAAAEELWTESIGKNAEAWLTTDNALPYQGEDFEKVLIHFIAALNDIGLNDYSNARVEARQITNDLELYNSKYKESKNAYRDDAFSRWLSGRLGETDNDDTESLNESLIDYRRAIEVYQKEYAPRYFTPVPTLVVADALRAADALGHDFQDQFQALRKMFPQVQFHTQQQVKKMGTVVFIHLCGEAPFKVDRFWTVPAGGDVLRIAYPEFLAKPHRITHALVRSQTGAETRTELMENITGIAIQNLNDHLGRIKGKAVARALAKFAAGQVAENVGSNRNDSGGVALAAAGKLWNLGNAIAEEADKRSWITLPASVTAGQIHVPPGPVYLDVDFIGDNGAAYEHAQMTTEVKAGETVFVAYRTYQ